MRPNYKALNSAGSEYDRTARVIGELPTPKNRRAALETATATISEKLGLNAIRCISFGLPVYTAFMTRPAAKKHVQNKLLLTKGDDVSLDYCPQYY